MPKQQAIGAIWEKEAKSGARYLSIEIDGTRYVAFVNEYKSEDRHPDWRVFLSQERPKPVVPDEDVPF